jgi:hypothetical protein
MSTCRIGRVAMVATIAAVLCQTFASPAQAGSARSADIMSVTASTNGELIVHGRYWCGRCDNAIRIDFLVQQHFDAPAMVTAVGRVYAGCSANAKPFAVHLEPSGTTKFVADRAVTVRYRVQSVVGDGSWSTTTRMALLEL